MQFLKKKEKPALL